MRLIQARVENYRIHERITVEFHPNTSLLGGSNEAGKSTLIEAIHRALFLPAKGDTQVHRNMRREGSSSRPEVRLRFEQEDQEWELHKHFGGNQRFTVTLRSPGRPPLEGDEAEARLAELTGAALPPGRRPNDDTVRQPWSHLWVWQGVAGADPSDAIAGTTDELVRIAAAGAGAMLMSETDSRLAALFRARSEALYGSAGRVRSSSELGSAQQTHAQFERQASELEQRVAALAADADRYADAVQRLANAEPKSLEVSSQINALEIRIQAGEAVRHRRDTALERRDTLNGQAEGLRTDAHQLDEWHEATTALTQKLETDRDAQRLATAHSEAVRLRDAANTALADARKALHPLAQSRDRAAARLRLLRAGKDLAAAGKANERVLRIEKDTQYARTELAGLPDISAKELATLREQRDAVQQDERRLSALACTLEVLHATRTPHLDGRALQSGECIDLSPESRLTLGDELSLKLVVPGAADAERHRDELDGKRAALTRSLARFAAADRTLDSVDRLAELLPRRTALSQRIKELEGRLAEEDAEAVRIDLSRAQAEMAAANIADRALAGESGESDANGSSESFAFDVARQAAEQATREHTAHEHVIEQHVTRLATAEQTLAKSVSANEEHARTRRTDEDELKKTRALMEDRLRHHDGDRQALQRALDKLDVQATDARQAFDTVQGELETLALDVLATRHARLVEQRERLRTAADRARDDMNESRGRLHQADGSDPDSDLRDVRERLDRARAELARSTLDAEASALLDTLYREGLDAANDRVTRPLAEKVGHYLRHLFGADAQVNVRYADGKLGEFYLSRPGFADTEEAFSSLSGGAREQVAAAVRLATAELLATRHGGTLPVVFDDAFVNTDPGRIEKVIDMLFQAGERGLQVIVGTCDPDRYQNIGQVQWRVERGRGAREA